MSSSGTGGPKVEVVVDTERGIVRVTVPSVSLHIDLQPDQAEELGRAIEACGLALRIREAQRKAKDQ
mgnify:CR=1 FL=1